MVNKITHYLIGASFLHKGQLGLLNFVIEFPLFPSRKYLTFQIIEMEPEATDITILGICPMTEIQNEQYGK